MRALFGGFYFAEKSKITKKRSVAYFWRCGRGIVEVRRLRGHESAAGEAGCDIELRAGEHLQNPRKRGD